MYGKTRGDEEVSYRYHVTNRELNSVKQEVVVFVKVSSAGGVTTNSMESLRGSQEDLMRETCSYGGPGCPIF